MVDSFAHGRFPNMAEVEWEGSCSVHTFGDGKIQTVQNKGAGRFIFTSAGKKKRIGRFKIV